MDLQELIGYAAGILTTFAVVPQILKAWTTRAVDDISLLTVTALIVGNSLWTAYGVLNDALPIIITNSIAVLLNCLLLGLVIYEKGHGGPPK